MGWVKGFEPSTPGTTIRCSNQLSYTHHKMLQQKGKNRNGTPEGTRTPDPLLRRQLLYPPELQTHIGAGDGNRTHATSLEGWNSTIELHPHQLATLRVSLHMIAQIGLSVNLFSSIKTIFLRFFTLLPLFVLYISLFLCHFNYEVFLCLICSLPLFSTALLDF